jgi:hypothetical protein
MRKVSVLTGTGKDNWTFLRVVTARNTRAGLRLRQIERLAALEIHPDRLDRIR